MANKRTYLRSVAERLAHYTLPVSCGCHIWLGATTRTCNGGYGQVWHEGAVQYTHRVVYALTHGEIPPGMYVCHTCDVPQCVNPAHLFLGTCGDNLRDMHQKGRAGTRRGVQHPRAKLTEAQVRRARKLYANGYSTRQLAEKYAVGHNTMWQLIAGRTWGSVK